LRQNIRDEWKVWVGLLVLCVGFAVWSLYAGRVAGRFLAGESGLVLGAMFVIYSIGGHVSAFRWWLGAEGERDTGREIEKLSGEWYCEHDLEHSHGNYDHVLVGPPGVFLLDSKLLHGTSVAGADALRSGRVSYAGRVFRGSAKRVKVELEGSLGHRGPWVQTVVVIWGDFPQQRHEEADVVYVAGDQLIPWLSGLPLRLNASQRAAFATALKEVRTTLRATRSVYGRDAVNGTQAQTEMQTNHTRRAGTPPHAASS
jgi:hypothetical protein